MKSLRIILCAGFLALAAAGVTGCATDNPDSTDNISSLPWNQPQSWEGPLPSTINQGR